MMKRFFLACAAIAIVIAAMAAVLAGARLGLFKSESAPKKQEVKLLRIGATGYLHYGSTADTSQPTDTWYVLSGCGPAVVLGDIAQEYYVTIEGPWDVRLRQGFPRDLAMEKLKGFEDAYVTAIATLDEHPDGHRVMRELIIFKHPSPVS